MLSLVVIVDLFWIVQMLHMIGVFFFSCFDGLFYLYSTFPSQFSSPRAFFSCYKMFLFSYYGLLDIAQFWQPFPSSVLEEAVLKLFNTDGKDSLLNLRVWVWFVTLYEWSNIKGVIKVNNI